MLKTLAHVWYAFRWVVRFPRTKERLAFYFIWWTFMPTEIVKAFFCIFLQNCAHAATYEESAAFLCLTFWFTYLYTYRTLPQTSVTSLKTYLWGRGVVHSLRYSSIKNSVLLAWHFVSARLDKPSYDGLLALSHYTELSESVSKLAIERRQVFLLTARSEE